MKNWWMNAALREKQSVVIGGFFLSLFLLYEITLAPLSSAVSTLRDSVANNQTLLSFMQVSNARIKKLSAEPHEAESGSTVSLLNLIQTEIDQTPLSKHVANLQQVESDTVDLKLQKVGFDNVMKWLIHLSQSHPLIITQASIIPLKDPGMVDADFKLKY